MSYSGSSGSGAALNTTLGGATQGGAVLFVQPSTLQLKEDYVDLTYSDHSDGKPLGVGIGPVSSPGGAFTGGYAKLQGVLHVEDPGASLAGSTTVYISSHTRAPLIVIQNALSYSAGVTGATVKLGVNSRNAELAPSSQVDDLVITSSIPASKLRIGKFSTGSGPILTVPLNTTTSFVGVGQDNPQATLHAGCGTGIPTTSNPVVYASRFGDTTVAVRDSTNAIELGLGIVSSVPFIGTATGHDLRLNLNGVARGIFKTTGDVFFGSTSPSTYNPESNVLGLTGFPSAAISIAGNQSSGTSSVGQLAWYNDATGLGTRVAALQINRASANNTVSANLQTMVSGTLATRIYVDGSGNVGVNTTSPQAQLDVTSTSTGILQPRMTADPSVVNGMFYYNSTNAAMRACIGGQWSNVVTAQPGQGGAAGGISGQVQYNGSGILNGSTNFTWDNTNSILGIGQPPVSAYLLDIRGSSDGVCCYNNFMGFFGTTTFDENRVDLGNSSGTSSWRIVGRGPFAPNGLTFGDVQLSRSGAVGRVLSIPSDTANSPVAYMTGTSFGIMTANPTSTLSVYGSVSTNVRTVTSTYLVGSSDSVLLADATSAVFSVTLPSSTNVGARRYMLKKIDSSSNAVLFQASGGNSIDGMTQQILAAQYTSAEVVSDNGNNWFTTDTVTTVSDVAARYYASSTSVSGSLATISWTTKDFDTHNAMSSGTYTVPVAGKYQVNAALLVTGTIGLNSTIILEIQKNGSVVSRNTVFAGGVMTDLTGSASDIISCVVGDTLRVQASTSATGPSIVSSNFGNYMSLARVSA